MPEQLSTTHEYIIPKAFSSLTKAVPFSQVAVAEAEPYKGIVWVLSPWALSTNRPTFFLRDQETLTIGDQLKWKQAEIISKTLHDVQQPKGKDDAAQQTSHLSSLQALSTAPRVLFRNASQVRSYLETHPDVNDLLLQAWPQLIKHFGQAIEVVLELLYWAEEQMEPELVGWIQSTDDIETGLQKLDAIADEWFLHRTEQFNTRFNFNIEFK
jgi:hypothetical protein